MSAPIARKPGQSNLQVRANVQPVSWIWDGLLAGEAVTLLAAPPKTGKTTVVSLLLDRRRAGGQLLGRTVLSGRSILCSEEEPCLWALRQPPLDFGDQLHYLRPHDQPSPRTWSRFINDVLDGGMDVDAGCFDLLIIDTAMTFLPTARNNPATLRNALEELRVVARLGVAVLLLDQTPIRPGPARGPLPPFADIIINMQAPLAARGRSEVTASRRRHFHGVGRYPGTLERVAAELNPEGTDYLLLPDQPGDPAEPDRSPALDILHQLVAASTTPLTRHEILARWPGSAPPPNADALSRTLFRACQLGLVTRSGAGTKAEPFRYAVASAEVKANVLDAHALLPKVSPATMEYDTNEECRPGI